MGNLLKGTYPLPLAWTRRTGGAAEAQAGAGAGAQHGTRERRGGGREQSEPETRFKLPTRPNRRFPVPIYRFGLTGNRSISVEFKIEFENLSSTGSYRYTGLLDRFTGGLADIPVI